MPTERVRRQERGRRRMAQILDAAEAEIAKAGFDNATTNAIADRAGVSPGSLYQFFANKTAILDGIAERYRENSAAFWDAQLGEDAAAVDLGELIDRVLQALTVFKTERPAYWVLFQGSAVSPRLAEVSAEIRSGIAARLREVLRAHAPELGEQRLDRLAQVSVAAVRGVFPMIMDAQGDKQAHLIAELKNLLHGYLAAATRETRAGPTGGNNGPAGRP